MGLSQQHPQSALGIQNEWLVFFLSTPIKTWVHKIGLTRPGFEHCLAVQYSPVHERWIMLDWNFCGADLLVLNELDLHHLFTWAARYDSTVVNYKAPRVDSVRKIIRMTPMTCVISVLHCLKLNQPGIHTPYQLYKHLVKTGGTIVREPEHG